MESLPSLTVSCTVDTTGIYWVLGEILSLQQAFPGLSQLEERETLYFCPTVSKSRLLCIYWPRGRVLLLASRGENIKSLFDTSLLWPVSSTAEEWPCPPLRMWCQLPCTAWHEWSSYYLNILSYWVAFSCFFGESPWAVLFFWALWFLPWPLSSWVKRPCRLKTPQLPLGPKYQPKYTTSLSCVCNCLMGMWLRKFVFSEDFERKEESMLKFLFCIKTHCMLVCFKTYN